MKMLFPFGNWLHERNTFSLLKKIEVSLLAPVNCGKTLMKPGVQFRHWRVELTKHVFPSLSKPGGVVLGGGAVYMLIGSGSLDDERRL